MRAQGSIRLQALEGNVDISSGNELRSNSANQTSISSGQDVRLQSGAEIHLNSGGENAPDAASILSPLINDYGD
jgi:uncharacterized protein (DUF2345 family)